MAELTRLRQLSQPKETATKTEELGSFLTTPFHPEMGELELAQLDLTKLQGPGT
jgi:hypothetical protein